MLECKGWIFFTVFAVVAIEVEVLLNVRGLVADICDGLAIFVFLMRISKNGSSFKLCSLGNFF